MEGVFQPKRCDIFLDNDRRPAADYLIGSGHERDKCEAVRHWVQQAVADLAPEQGYPLLADLMMKLEKELLGKGVGTRH